MARTNEGVKRTSAVWFIGLAVAAAACGGFSSDLDRAEDAYREARYEDALVWLGDLERRGPMPSDQILRAKYYYLRGMTAYRLGERSDALYFLAVAKELAGTRSESVLGTGGSRTLDRTLGELASSSRSVSLPAPR